MSATDFEQLKREFQDAWCNQADGLKFSIDIVPASVSVKDEYEIIARVELPRVIQPGDGSSNLWGFCAVVRKDPRTTSDCQTLKDLCSQAGTALPQTIRASLHGLFAFPTDQPEDLWLTLLVILNGVTWPPRRYFQWFNPFEASLNAIEQCGLDTDSPQFPAVTDDITDADADDLLVSVQDLHILTFKRAPINTIRDHLKRKRVNPCGTRARHQKLFRYSDVLPVWDANRLREPLPPEKEAKARLRTASQVSNS